jgi:O-methyltransferase
MIEPAELRQAYLDLLKRSLLGSLQRPVQLYRPLSGGDGSFVRNKIQKQLQRRGQSLLATRVTYAPPPNRDGELGVDDLPPGIMTMIGQTRLDDTQRCLVDVIERGVPGDVIETGVWQGGTTIFMRAVLWAYGETGRSVYVADSFEGLPPPDTDRYPADEGQGLHTFDALAVSLEEVQANFERYGLGDEQVVFVKGWFRDTLPGLADHTWAVVRLDGDYYESTMDGLVNLYPGLSPGGWLIVDDYSIEACRLAVRDYREQHGITDEIHRIDWTGVYWQKSAN